jgi:hypothetical protein
MDNQRHRSPGGHRFAGGTVMGPVAALILSLAVAVAGYLLHRRRRA